MFYFIWSVTFLFAFLLYAVSLETCPSSNSLLRNDFVSAVARYLVMVVVAFPCTAFSGMRTVERVLQRAGMKLLFYAGAFSGRASISEILLSASISLCLMALFAARRCAGRLVHRAHEAGGTNISSDR